VVVIYVEGGGDQASLKTECRRAFSDLLKRAGFEGRMPSVRPAGRRDAAFGAFRVALDDSGDGVFVILLVDSETSPATKDPWAHLRSQAHWDKPTGATDDHAQLMVVCMETWLMADPDACEGYFGKDFKKDKLLTTDLEGRSKEDIYRSIYAATNITKPKGKYGKARDSFKILGRIDPKKLANTCGWAARFFAVLTKYC
jgi:uncharacterized protein DUF4276